MPHGAAHDLAQHVAAPFVRRHHAVGNQERGGAGVVGDHAHRDVAGRHRLAVVMPGPLADGGEQRHEQRRVVVRHAALHDGRDALEAHAGVDRRRRQGRQRALVVAFELHEHVVPDLDEALAPALDVFDEAAGAGDRGAAVDVDLGAASAGAGVAHGPEVVGHAELADVVGRHEVEPALAGLLVTRNAGRAFEHGHIQRGRVELPFLGQQVPGQLDGVVLEVVAEREVAEHLEEGVVPERGADVVEVVVLAADAHALLRRGGARVITLLAAEKHVLELVHAGVGEQQRGVVAREQGAARYCAVAVFLEVIQEGSANLGRMHLSIVSPASAS